MVKITLKKLQFIEKIRKFRTIIGCDQGKSGDIIPLNQITQKNIFGPFESDLSDYYCKSFLDSSQTSATSCQEHG